MRVFRIKEDVICATDATKDLGVLNKIIYRIQEVSKMINRIFENQNRKFVKNLMTLKKFPYTPISSDKKNARTDICNQCQYFVATDNKCNKCMCYVDIVTEIELFKCPENKW